MTAIHEDNPHKMSKPIFWEKYIKMLSAEIVPNKLSVIFFFYFVFTVFQEYFTYIEPILHQRWAKTGEPVEKPPDPPQAELGFPTCDPSKT